ncbi:MAG: peroxide stress protein YaaA [Fusicatenibacter sp.]|nr:peroxide stress protein YaaA [Fusicatenibacter sp.]
MKIILSPAKKMNVRNDDFVAEQLPVFLEDTKLLHRLLCGKSFGELQELWKCNNKLAQENYRRLQEMDLEQNLTPALFAYEGLQYQHMAAGVLTAAALDYLRDHLRILSGFYGVLAPFDGVTPYRLEMQAALKVENRKNLYEFWGNRLYEAVWEEDGIILNLASKEYAKCIEPYLRPEDHMITVIFGELQNGKIHQKGTLAKMARGEMVRYLAENQVTDLLKIREFPCALFHYSEEFSDSDHLVFLNSNQSKTT